MLLATLYTRAVCLLEVVAKSTQREMCGEGRDCYGAEKGTYTYRQNYGSGTLSKVSTQAETSALVNCEASRRPSAGRITSVYHEQGAGREYLILDSSRPVANIQGMFDAGAFKGQLRISVSNRTCARLHTLRKRYAYCKSVASNVDLKSESNKEADDAPMEQSQNEEGQVNMKDVGNTQVFPPVKAQCPPDPRNERPVNTEFVFPSVHAKHSMHLLGDWNEWHPIPMRRDGLDGRGRIIWTVVCPVPRGYHEFLFLVDGKYKVISPSHLKNRSGAMPGKTILNWRQVRGPLLVSLKELSALELFVCQFLLLLVRAKVVTAAGLNPKRPLRRSLISAPKDKAAHTWMISGRLLIQRKSRDLIFIFAIALYVLLLGVALIARLVLH